MKNLKRVTFLVAAIVMLFSISALAADTQATEQAPNDNELMCYYDGEGRMLTNIDGEVFQVLDVDDENSQVVTGPLLLAQLNCGTGNYAVSKTPYDYDLTRGSYTTNVNLDNGTWTSPVFKRGNYECTGIHLPSGRMVQLIDANYSPKKFNVTIDLNNKYGASIGGLLT